MAIASKVSQLVRSQLEADFARLDRDHTKLLAKIASDPKRFGNHLNSGTHGRAIFDAICLTYQLRSAAIDDALTSTLRFQLNEPLTVDELTAAFRSYFEPEQIKILDQSRTRLSGIKDGRFINETVLEANRVVAAFRVRAEHIVADHQARDRAKDERPAEPQHVTGTGALELSGVAAVAFGKTEPFGALERAAEISRELERLRPVLKKLKDHELSALSAPGAQPRTYLHAQKHVFSVLTDEMVAEQFREELEDRKHRRREGWHAWLRSPGILLAILGLILTVVLAKCGGGPSAPAG